MVWDCCTGNPAPRPLRPGDRDRDAPRPAGRGRCQPASRPSVSTFISPPGPVLPGPAGLSVLVPGWDRGVAIAKEADNDPDSHRIQRTSRTAEAQTPALTGEHLGGRVPGGQGTGDLGQSRKASEGGGKEAEKEGGRKAGPGKR